LELQVRYEVAIAGAGVMGLATAYALLKRGVGRVVVLEKHRVGHDRAASTDDTKAIRYEYGDNELYARMVGRSIEMWRGLEAEAGADLYVNSGVVCWGRGDAPYTRASYKTLSRLGIPIREVSTEELCREYPQFDPADISYAAIDPEGGFLRASECVAALARRVRELGGAIREGAGVVGLAAHGDGVTLQLTDDEQVQAGRVVLAAGAWSSTLLPRLGLALPLTANKQQVVYFSGLGPEFAPGRFPVFLNLDHDFYGFPLDRNGLLKASLHAPGPVIDPDVPQPPDAEFEAAIIALLARYIPRAARGKLQLSRVCMYAMTPDEDFCLDCLPGHPNVVFGAGFSGHGFKFGILIGELLAALSLGEEPEFPLSAFSLQRLVPAS
jgi:monomeric sarcosine oxidase